MAKTLKEAPLSTRAGRSKLPPGVHWRALDAEVHLGYRKSGRGAKWLVRWYDDGRYRQETIAGTDDLLAADGDKALSFAQARSRAREVVETRRADARAATAGPVLNVAAAVNRYVERTEARIAPRFGARRDARSRLGKHVLVDPLAEIPLHRLEAADLIAWKSRRQGLTASSVARIENDLKAALNFAALEHRARLPANFSLSVRHGLAATGANATAARLHQVLNDDEIRRLVAAAHEVDSDGNWDGDLARIIILLAATGARFLQVASMKIDAVQFNEGRLLLPASAKGRGQKHQPFFPFRVGEDVLDALRPAVTGRRAADPLLERWRHIQISPQVWQRDSRGPWRNASELTRPWRLIVKKAGLPAGIVPYALRHSSIVRHLRLNIPVRLVAALHDTSTTMIEKHYSADIISALDDIAATAIIPLAPASASSPSASSTLATRSPP